MKIITLIIILVASLNAAEITFVNAFPIYVYGDASYLASVYRIISNISTDTSVQIIMGLGFSAAMGIAGFKARYDGAGAIIKSVAAPITLYALFAVPTVNVHIVDQRVDKGLIDYSVPDGGYRVVENIPYAIAFVPSSSSVLVSVFIDIIDNASADISIGNKFSTMGFQKVSEVSKTALVVANLKDINTSGILYDMNQYIKQCLVGQGLKTPANTHTLTHPAKPFPEMFNPANYAGDLGATKVSFDDGIDSASQPVKNVACSTLYATYVSGKTAKIEADLLALLKSHERLTKVDSADFQTAWREQIGDASATVGTIQKAMSTTAATRALERVLDTEGIGVNGVSMATELSIDATLANLRTEGLAKWEWITRAIPDAITIVLGIMIGAFPIMVVVMSFMGVEAKGGVANYFMGYLAFNFNFVSLALVNNIISYYTSQNAAEAMASYAGMPFGLSQINGFMMQQADMAGLAGIIGAVSVFAVTPLIFKGEAAGFSAAMSAIGGAYRGNVAQSAQKNLTDFDAQKTLDEQALTMDGMTESEAAEWLSKEGFTKPNNMSSVAAYNDMMKNYGTIASADASQILHSGKGGINAGNYIDGAAMQSHQKNATTAGLGASGATMESAGTISFEDGEVMGAKIEATDSLRHNTPDGGSRDYDTSAIGAGQAIQQYAKDMASATQATLDKDAAASVANATTAVATQIGAGQGILKFGEKSGVVNSDGTINPDNSVMKEIMTGAAMQGAGKLKSLEGAGDSINGTIENDGFDDFLEGNEFQGRMGANKTIADGEKWKAMGDDDLNSSKVSLMAQVKENEKVSTFGGIAATNAELQEHGGVDGAIKDMITGAQEKGKGAATHAENLREKYDDDLNGKNSKGMTLSETMKAIDMSKLDSQEGQAAGVLANKGINSDMYSDNAMYGEMSNQQKTQAKLDAQGGIGGAVGVDTMEASQKASQQKGAVEKTQEEAAKIAGETIGKTAADVLEETAGRLAAGKLEKDVGAIEGAEKRGGYEAASFKSGVESGAGMGAAYDNMAAMINSDDPSKVAQTLKNRTSMTDTKRHLVEDIGAFGLDKFNKAFGTDYNSETAAAVALMGGGAVAAEAFQALRGQKGPIRTTVGAAKNGVVKAAELSGLIKPNPENIKDAPHGTNSHQDQSSINQNDSTHKNSFSDVKNYSQEYAKSKEAFDRESQNLQNLQTQRENLAAQGKDTTVLDNKIEDASKKVDGHRSDMDTANRNVKAEKYMAGKHTPKAGASSGGKGGWLSALALPIVNEAANVFGVDKSESLIFTGIEAGAKIMDGAFGAAINTAEGAVFGAVKGLRGDKDAGSYFTSHMSAAASNFTSGISGAQNSFATYAVNQEANRQTSGDYSGGALGSVNRAASWVSSSHGPAGGSGQVPGSSQYRSAAPAYAQNAFSTPSGFNTMSAMSGKTAFNDATNVANATPQSFKTDTSLSSLDSAKDISFGVEGTQDSIMDLQETMADLMQTIYKK